MTTTKNTDMTVANTIARQLGSAIAMLGAKNLVGSDRSLQFKIGRNPKRVTHVRVELDASDTYTVTFHRVPSVKAMCKGAETVELASVPMVYADQLHATLEAHTGNFCSL